MRNVYLANCTPENWEACRESTIFGVKAHMPNVTNITKGDLILLRRTATPYPNYGVIALWYFDEKIGVDEQTEVPWPDGPYTWVLKCKMIVELPGVFNEQFKGTSGSAKIPRLKQLQIMPALVGPLKTDQARAYLEGILKEFGRSLSSSFDFLGQEKTAESYLKEILEHLPPLDLLTVVQRPKVKYKSGLTAEVPSIVMAKNVWCLYVGKESQGDFESRLHERKWKVQASQGQRGIDKDSVVIFLFNIEPVTARIGFPNVNLESFIGCMGQADRIVVVRVASDIRNHDPHLEEFAFETLIDSKQAYIRKVFTSIQIDAIRHAMIAPGTIQAMRATLFDLRKSLESTSQESRGLDVPAESQTEAVVAEPWPVEEARRKYSLEEFSGETGYSVQTVSSWIGAIRRKQQAILFGPPGTGKTFIAEKLSRYLVGEGHGIEGFVQFHPAYAYEDFVQGIRPVTINDGKSLTYSIVPGRFLEFCEKAQQQPDISVLIIDEINRANLARVFGELMYLLEYRDREIPLASGGTFKIPENVYIIGTMNTADRSIALVDYALRRRFAFIPLFPNTDVLRTYHEKYETGFPVEELIRILTKVNELINDQNYFVGVSFFLRNDLQEHIESIWSTEILPYLMEYFSGQTDKLEEFKWDKIKAGLL